MAFFASGGKHLIHGQLNFIIFMIHEKLRAARSLPFLIHNF